MNHSEQEPSKKPTARRHLVAELTHEILKNPNSKDFSIASEHQLCRRFGVSRVTVRLALGDLENQGLVYRRHGRGTFAYGHSMRVHRNLGILFKSPDALKHAFFNEIIRGAQTIMTSLRSSVVLISVSPLEWRAETARSLGAIIVMEQEITIEELANLKSRHLPFFCIQESNLIVSDQWGAHG
jgi:DNA-binding transcriptional regulator YhcF (GntR family)